MIGLWMVPLIILATMTSSGWFHLLVLLTELIYGLGVICTYNLWEEGRQRLIYGARRMNWAELRARKDEAIGQAIADGRTPPLISR